MSAEGDVADGDPDEPAPDVDRLVLDALTSGVDVAQVAERLRTEASVTRAEVRPGLVKTHPPLAELVVEYTTGDGGTRARVYDLEVVPGRALRLARTHASPVTPNRPAGGERAAGGTGDTVVTPP
ncbi:hypothetical protein [Actinotalea sp. K2]|uniref:hypothetical protein n=1 Tax=Actinotalea sp. K2 TaxID=2939438 RepID=UPI0020179882|nr:hypothetical protein [Actinotalea sp. K2]MCL3860431.1 hypothetical protein [Actinotalea sp. K2]